MVGNYPHCHVCGLAVAIACTAKVSYSLYDGLEDIGVVVRMLALQGTYQTFESHASVYDVHAERFEMSVGLALELHEYDVPYLDDLWVVLVYHVASWYLCLFFGRTAIEVYFGAWSAWSRVSHFPEIVVLVAIDDMVGRHMLQPV